MGPPRAPSYDAPNENPLVISISLALREVGQVDVDGVKTAGRGVVGRVPGRRAAACGGGGAAAKVS